MSAPRRVAVTGIGLVSPLGSSPADFWERLLRGPSGVAALTRFDPARFSSRLAAQVDDAAIAVRRGPYAHELKRMDRFVQYAVAAAGDALAASGLAPPGAAPLSGGGIFIGVGMGGLPNMEAGVMRQETRGPRKSSPYLIPSLIPNMAAGMTALTYHIGGPQYTIAGACASGNQALGQAMAAIRSGELAWALAGGSEGVITPIAFSGFEAMRVLSAAHDAGSAPRPFDARSDGMVVGEGAAIFVLEDAERAAARGAAVHALLAGYATSSGSAQIALQSRDEMVACMRQTLGSAALAPGEVDCVLAQASGMSRGDACELEALAEVFAGGVPPPAVTSIKGHVGHTFAASGPLNLVAALGALRAQTVPPTRNFEAAAPRHAGIDLVREPRRRPLRNCLINTFGFGGINAGLLVAAA